MIVSQMHRVGFMIAVCLCVLSSAGLCQETVITIEGTVPDDVETHFFLP